MRRNDSDKHDAGVGGGLSGGGRSGKHILIDTRPPSVRGEGNAGNPTGSQGEDLARLRRRGGDIHGHRGAGSGCTHSATARSIPSLDPEFLALRRFECSGMEGGSCGFIGTWRLSIRGLCPQAPGFSALVPKRRRWGPELETGCARSDLPIVLVPWIARGLVPRSPLSSCKNKSCDRVIRR
jgi:hypothetical protein